MKDKGQNEKGIPIRTKSTTIWGDDALATKIEFYSPDVLATALTDLYLLATVFPVRHIGDSFLDVMKKGKIHGTGK